MKVSKSVEDILKVSRKARNSDKELMLLVMEKFGLYLTKAQQDKFKDMPSFESVRRVRQKLQEQGLYLADQRIRTERHWKAMRMQQNMPKAKPQDIDRIILPWGE